MTGTIEPIEETVEESIVAEPKDYHKYPIWGLRLPPRYKVAVEQLSKKGRRSPTEEVKIAIEAYYESVMGKPFPTS